MLKVRIKTLPHYDGLPLPSYATALSAGIDIMAAIDEPVVLKARGRIRIPTGLCMAIPEGYELQFRGRSGLASKHGVGLVNGVGTIDADYRGEINLILRNHSDDDFIIERGMRMAQGIFAKYEKVSWEPVTELEETERGTGGLGSTGLK